MSIRKNICSLFNGQVNIQFRLKYVSAIIQQCGLLIPEMNFWLISCTTNKLIAQFFCERQFYLNQSYILLFEHSQISSDIGLTNATEYSLQNHETEVFIFKEQCINNSFSITLAQLIFDAIVKKKLIFILQLFLINQFSIYLQAINQVHVAIQDKLFYIEAISSLYNFSSLTSLSKNFIGSYSKKNLQKLSIIIGAATIKEAYNKILSGGLCHWDCANCKDKIFDNAGSSYVGHDQCTIFIKTCTAQVGASSKCTDRKCLNAPNTTVINDQCEAYLPQGNCVTQNGGGCRINTTCEAINLEVTCKTNVNGRNCFWHNAKCCTINCANAPSSYNSHSQFLFNYNYIMLNRYQM
ncbi:unnamed protein product [Paramecium sonneborni]|uniref:Uncharacterized protein n=1 Tax=Paramecium sonneborni TaxID=65129 RepID=A0A8S1R8K1_9CILI|nr:unnamed protein product [Paramecium sonneborni]